MYSRPGSCDVVGPVGAAGDQPRVLLAAQRLADDVLPCRCLERVGHSRTSVGGRVLHGLDDVLVAGAPAEVALEPVADLVLARVGFSLSRSIAAMIMPGVQ